MKRLVSKEIYAYNVLLSIYPSYFEEGDNEATLKDDLEIELLVFDMKLLLKKGYTRSICESLLDYIFYYRDLGGDFALDYLQNERKSSAYHLRGPLWYTGLAPALHDAFDIDVESFMRKYVGRDVKKYFKHIPDDKLVTIINMGYITKPMLKTLLEMANDSGRPDVASAIINLRGEDENLSRFSL